MQLYPGVVPLNMIYGNAYPWKIWSTLDLQEEWIFCFHHTVGKKNCKHVASSIGLNM